MNRYLGLGRSACPMRRGAVVARGRPIFPRLAVLSLGFLCVGNRAGAQTTRYVSVTTCPNTGSGTMLSPYCSIQTAIDVSATSSNDVIMVLPGTYHEVIDFKNKTLTVESTMGPADTTIDGTGHGGAVVDFGCNLPLCANGIFRGFTVTGGEGSGGHGILVSTASPTIDNCVITGNTADCGGGISIRSSNTQILNTTISNNTAQGTGTCFGAPTLDGGGGGIWINGPSSVTIDWCDIVGNESALEGGGIRSVFSNVTIRHTTISNNTATGVVGGGGAFFRGASSSSESFAGPSATRVSAESSVLLTNTVVASNEATGSGSCRQWPSRAAIACPSISSPIDRLRSLLGLSGACDEDQVLTDAVSEIESNRTTRGTSSRHRQRSAEDQRDGLRADGSGIRV